MTLYKSPPISAPPTHTPPFSANKLATMDVSSTQKWLQDTPLYLDSILKATSWLEAKDVRMTPQHRLWERAFLLFQFHESCYPLPALPCVIRGHMLLCTLVGASMTFPAASPHSHNTHTTPYTGGQSRWYRVINLDALTVRVLPGTNTCSMSASPVPGRGGPKWTPVSSKIRIPM